jgi:putative ABC transport system permease protein
MTGLLRVKLVRDLRAIWPRLALMVVAIAVSLTVFGAVLQAWSGIRRETVNAYAGTEPASATIVFARDVDAARMRAVAGEVARRPGVLAAAGRAQFTTDVRVDGQPRAVPLQVFAAAPDDPMRVATFRVESGTWPPAPGEILVRRDALTLLGTAVGDTLTVTGPDGTALTVRVAGTVYDPSLAPSPQQQTGAAYLSMSSLGAAGMDQLKVTIAGPDGTPTRDRDAAVAAATEIGRWLQDTEGLAVREIQVPEPYRHPHQWQADVILLSLLAGGAVALLLSAILVATMLNSLFLQHIPQIGVMKAIGATATRIGRLYLAMTLLVAAVATAVAFVPAVLLGRAGVGAFVGFLGIEAASVAAPWWTFVVIVLIGLGLPPLMVTVPLVRAARITVRAAMDHRGVPATSGRTGAVLARITRLPILSRTLRMAVRNAARRPARFVLAVGLLGCAGMVFVAGLSLNAGTDAIDAERRAQRTWDVEVQLSRPADTATVTAVARDVAGVDRVEAWNRLQTGVADAGGIPVTRTYPDQGHGSVAVTAIGRERTMLPVPDLLDGRWLTDDAPGEVVINQVTRINSLPDARPGDRVQLVIDGRNTTWTLVGIVEEREGGSGGVYVTATGLATALGRPPQVNQVRVATTAHDEASRDVAADAVNRALTDAGVPVQSATSVSRSDAVSAGHLGPVLLILLGIAIPLGVIGVIGLASTMSANVLDRTREFAIMHAIGAQPKTVRRVVVVEGVLLAVTSCVLAAVPTLGLTALLGDGLGNLFMYAPLPFRISLPAVAIWTALVVLGAILATDAAANRASRTTVREALTHI